MALSLAAKLGSRGLQAYSLHPGVYMSNLARDVDWSVDLQGLRKKARNPNARAAC